MKIARTYAIHWGPTTGGGPIFGTWEEVKPAQTRRGTHASDDGDCVMNDPGPRGATQIFCTTRPPYSQFLATTKFPFILSGANLSTWIDTAGNFRKVAFGAIREAGLGFARDITKTIRDLLPTRTSYARDQRRRMARRKNRNINRAFGGGSAHKVVFSITIPRVGPTRLM